MNSERVFDADNENRLFVLLTVGTILSAWHFVVRAFAHCLLILHALILFGAFIGNFCSLVAAQQRQCADTSWYSCRVILHLSSSPAQTTHILPFGRMRRVAISFSKVFGIFCVASSPPKLHSEPVDSMEVLIKRFNGGLASTYPIPTKRWSVFVGGEIRWLILEALRVATNENRLEWMRAIRVRDAYKWHQTFPLRATAAREKNQTPLRGEDKRQSRQGDKM